MTRTSTTGRPALQKPKRSLSLAVGLAVTGLVCTSCAGKLGGGHFRSVIDPTTTSSVSADAVEPVEREKLSDEATIRNAVSSVNLEELGARPLPWANLDTGSRGAITRIAEHRRNGLICRRFVVSRESFEGVGLYRGDACLLGGGKWLMTDFTAI